MTATHDTNSPQQTEALGRQVGAELNAGDCLALSGELGAGKTCFVRGLAAGLGCDTRLVSSPTYVLCQEYPGRVPLFHLDLYRMADPSVELADLGIEEMLAAGVVVIEWAERAAEALPRPRREIRFELRGKTSRRLQIARVE